MNNLKGCLGHVHAENVDLKSNQVGKDLHDENLRNGHLMQDPMIFNNIFDLSIISADHVR